MPASRPRLEIVIVSDVVCPWCYIGKRQLEAALARWREASGPPEPLLRWLPYQLNPDLAPQGIPRSEYLQRKFGDAGMARFERVRTVAREAGLELQLDRIERQPNTLKAHALIDLAAEAGLQSEAAEALFHGYFTEGADLSDDAALRRLAERAGLNDEIISGALQETTVLERVAQMERDIRAQGVQGVPLFVMGLEGEPGVAVSGAQGTQALWEAMQRGAAGALEQAPS